MTGDERSKSSMIAACKRNLRLLQRAAVVCSRMDGDPVALHELSYLFETLYRLIVRLEALPVNSGSFDEVFNDALAMTVAIVKAYEKARERHPDELGDFLIMSPGGHRSRKHTRQDLRPGKQENWVH